MNQNQFEKPGYLNTEEAYGLLMWIYDFYGNPVRFPSLDVVKGTLNSKPFISYEKFVDFIEPYYSMT
jgi:hypothetical protein